MYGSLYILIIKSLTLSKLIYTKDLPINHLQHTHIMGRAPCCDKANVKKGPWSPDEDSKLKAYIQDHGIGGNWIALPQKIGLKRCGKSCRLRWLNYLRPNIKHGSFSEEEDNIICTLFLSIGSRWSIIAAQLPGRTDNDIKNYWNTKLKKKLMGKQSKARQMARREMVIKSESTTTENKHMLYENMMNPNSYYPELTVHVPNQLNPSLDGVASDQLDSIARFLLSLEGNYYDEHQQPNISTPSLNLECPNLEYVSPYQDTVYQNSTNLLSSQKSLNEGYSNFPNMCQGFNYQPHEQLETSFGVDTINCTSGDSSIESSHIGDINSMVYDPSMVVQDCIFQEYSSCFGIQ